MSTTIRDVLLEIRGLKTHFFTYEGVVQALDGVDLKIRSGETLGLVGETGCGKSVTALSIMRLIQEPGEIVGGEIIFNGEDLLKKSDEEMREIRGKKMSMIFQEPMSALNPVYTVGEQITEVITLPNVNRRGRKKIALEKAIEQLKKVEIADPEKIINSYPHELSGGMCQRVMIAMALAPNPNLLIADEPTTALDVTIQAQILELMKELIAKHNASVLLITHDLSVIVEMCDRCAVMYGGNIVEYGSIGDIFERAMHPYTRGLIDAIPKLTTKQERLNVIDGFVPNLINPPHGCKFHPRCKYAMDICRKKKPELKELEKNHQIACFL